MKTNSKLDNASETKTLRHIQKIPRPRTIDF